MTEGENSHANLSNTNFHVALIDTGFSALVLSSDLLAVFLDFLGLESRVSNYISQVMIMLLHVLCESARVVVLANIEILLEGDRKF
jgi:hypothetical protein